jgi:multidrug efflux pump
MFAAFFIDRPILSWVLSLVILVVGIAAIFALPVAQYPEIAPPTVTVTATYPGANAQTVADSVAAPIEQQVNGVDKMLYMSSQCTNDGAYNLTVTFDLGTDPNMNQVLVQNRVSLAMPQLPNEVQVQGVTTKKKSPSILLVVNLYSPSGEYDDLYLSNYATIQIRDELLRLPGVGDVTYLGQRDYSIRVWLDPDQMATKDLSASDVYNAIKAQNVQVAAGQVGRQPVPKGQQFQYVMSTLGRLEEVEQFANIIIKSGQTGEKVDASTPIVRVRDVARVEMGAQQYDQIANLSGRPTVGLAVYQLPGSNALEVAKQVRIKMETLKKRFPKGIDYGIVYDTTPFVEESIHEVYKTLIEAVVLVAIVVLLFLQDWKAMILPMIDVPVSLIGAFAVMAVMGFSLNTLTLFGLVLAIGIVVDDAIMVLENIERLIGTGLPARQATITAMGEITGPIIAVTLVLTSVFLPAAFLPGVTGQFYRQFALTIAATMMISAMNAMTLTPSRAVGIFKGQESGGHGGHEHQREALPWWAYAIFGGVITYKYGLEFVDHWLGVPPKDDPTRLLMPGYLTPLSMALAAAPGVIGGGLLGLVVVKPINRVLSILFKGFNWCFDHVAGAYAWSIGVIVKVGLFVLLGYFGLLYLTYYTSKVVPKGFIPDQDQGYLLVNVQLPDAASVQRTQKVMETIQRLALGDDVWVFDLKNDTRVRGRILREGKAGELGLTKFSSETEVFEIDPLKGTKEVVHLEKSRVRKHARTYNGPPPPPGAKRYDGIPGVGNTVSVAGQSFVLNAAGSNFGSCFVVLEPFEMRSGDHEKYDATVARKLTALINSEIKDFESITAFRAPPIQGLGSAGGFQLQVEQRGFVDLMQLQKSTDGLIARAREDKRILALFTGFRAQTPQFDVDIDRTKCEALGLTFDDVFATLQIYMGGAYVNLFNKYGRTWQVNVQADEKFRMDEEAMRQMKIRNKHGDMVPLGSVAEVKDRPGPVMVMRYNTYVSAPVNGIPKPGVSSGDAVRIMEEAAKEENNLPIEWTQITFLQLREGAAIVYALILGTLLVYLVLAAQYESWSLPLSIILVVPMCILCAVTGMLIVKMPLDIFVQIGFLVLVGLAAKNAILIVEFAHQNQKSGMPKWKATVEACRQRLRPIIMTSAAFTLGVVPLVLGHGAGAEMRQSLGTAVFAGMIGVTGFGLFLTPVFYYLIAPGTPEEKVMAVPVGGPKVEPPSPVPPAPPTPPGDGHVTATPHGS